MSSFCALSAPFCISSPYNSCFCRQSRRSRLCIQLFWNGSGIFEREQRNVYRRRGRQLYRDRDGIASAYGDRDGRAANRRDVYGWRVGWNPRSEQRRQLCDNVHGDERRRHGRDSDFQFDSGGGSPCDFKREQYRLYRRRSRQLYRDGDRTPAPTVTETGRASSRRDVYGHRIGRNPGSEQRRHFRDNVLGDRMASALPRHRISP